MRRLFVLITFLVLLTSNVKSAEFYVAVLDKTENLKRVKASTIYTDIVEVNNMIFYIKNGYFDLADKYLKQLIRGMSAIVLPIGTYDVEFIERCGEYSVYQLVVRN